jgi:GAF domain-containing protein
MYMHDRFNGVVICANKEGGFDEWDDDVLLALGDQAGAILQNGRLQGQLRDAYMSTVALLAEAVAAKDPFVHANAQEVSGYVEAVAQRLDVRPAGGRSCCSARSCTTSASSASPSASCSRRRR